MNLAIVSPQFRILRHGDDHLIQTQEAGEVHKVLRAIGEVDQATQGTGEVHRGTQVNGDDLEMKIERSRDLQVDRIDRQKLDKPIFAQEGERPQAPDGRLLDDTVGLFIRRNGQWRQIGLSQSQVAEVADQEIAAAPRTTIINSPGTTTTSVGTRTTVIKTYIAGNPPPLTFSVKWFLNKDDYIDGIEMDAADIPENITFSPATPEQEAGTHRVVIEFTPRIQAPVNDPMVLELELT